MNIEATIQSYEEFEIELLDLAILFGECGWCEYTEQDAIEINERMDEDALFNYWLQR